MTDQLDVLRETAARRTTISWRAIAVPPWEVCYNPGFPIRPDGRMEIE